MPIGFFRSVPKVEINLDKDSYSFGDELQVRVNVQTDRPGLKVRRAVVQLLKENRYTQSSMVSIPDTGAAKAGIRGMRDQVNQTAGSVNLNKRVTEDRIDRVPVGRERLFTDGVIRHRNETFDLIFELMRPTARQISDSGLSYQVKVHFDLPLMRDVEMHKSVPVRLV